MVSMIHVKGQLEKLRDELEDREEVRDQLELEKPEDEAAIVQLMSEVAGSLQRHVAGFLGYWDFTEDCRRAREKEAAEVAATV